MQIHDLQQKQIQFNGKTYPVNLSFDAILNAADILQDDSYTEMDRVDIAAWLLTAARLKRKEKAAFVAAVFALLEKKERPGKKCMDFKQDAGRIRAAFRQAYGIDLAESIGRLSWQEFVDLLGAVPADTRLAEYVRIRTMPVPVRTKHNGEAVSAILKAKAECALKVGTECGTQEGLTKMFDALASVAERR